MERDQGPLLLLQRKHNQPLELAGWRWALGAEGGSFPPMYIQGASLWLQPILNLPQQIRGGGLMKSSASKKEWAGLEAVQRVGVDTAPL